MWLSSNTVSVGSCRDGRVDDARDRRAGPRELRAQVHVEALVAEAEQGPLASRARWRTRPPRAAETRGRGHGSASRARGLRAARAASGHPQALRPLRPADRRRGSSPKTASEAASTALPSGLGAGSGRPSRRGGEPQRPRAPRASRAPASQAARAPERNRLAAASGNDGREQRGAARRRASLHSSSTKGRAQATKQANQPGLPKVDCSRRYSAPKKTCDRL